MNSPLIEVALIGKSVGLKGFLRLHNRSDFSIKFKKGARFYDKSHNIYEIESFDEKNSLVKFLGYDDVTNAKKLTNLSIFTTKEDITKNFKLKKDEYFYFDIIGAKVIENSVILGVIDEIYHIGFSYLFFVKTDENLTKQKFAKNFYIPYNDNFIIQVDLNNKIIICENAMGILENS